MRKLILGPTVAAAALAVAAPANAAVVFSNDFESGGYTGTGYVILPAYEGWTSTSGPGIEVQYGSVAGTPHSGTHLVELDSTGNSAMSHAIGAGDYTLSFYYSDRPNIPASSNGIDVLLNGVSIFSVAGGNGSGNTVWSLQSFSFTASAASTLTFAALGTSDSLGGYLDDVTLTAIPEASTWAMMLAGMGLVGAAVRRRKARVSFA